MVVVAAVCARVVAALFIETSTLRTLGVRYSSTRGTDGRERWNTSEKVQYLRGVIAAAALWERRNRVGTDGCFWPALHGVRTFGGVWVKLVRKPIVPSSPVL